jgi:hypothetical protein
MGYGNETHGQCKDIDVVTHIDEKNEMGGHVARVGARRVVYSVSQRIFEADS